MSYLAAKLRGRHRRLDRINDAVADVLSAMRAGAALHLQQSPSGPHWRLSSGRSVTNGIARIVIINKSVSGEGDGLFSDALSQTWRYTA